MYGLGYDSASDDYKMVTLSYYDTDNEHGYDPTTDDYCTEMFVNVSSFKTDSWKRAESSPYDHAVGHVTSGVFVNECIHWLASRTTDYKSAIVAFDLVEEKFRKLPPPSSVDSDKFVFNYLALLGGCLCMFNENETYVWMMKEYGVQESWTKFTINDLDATEIKLLCLLGREKLVLLKDDEQLVIYNFKEGTLKDVAVCGSAEDLHVEASFVESLVSPHGYYCTPSQNFPLWFVMRPRVLNKDRKKSPSTYAPGYRRNRSAVVGGYQKHGELCLPDPISSEPTSILAQIQQESLLFISYNDFALPNFLSYAYFSNAVHLFDEITVSAEKLRFAGDPSTCTQIVGSCHGLLLLRNWDDEIFVLNPITRELREVPNWPCHPCAPHPSKSCSENGFGYDSVSDDYKIVTITSYEDTDDADHNDELDDDTNQGDEPYRIEMFVNVYSLKTGTWKRAESSPKDGAGLRLHSGVFVDGCIHWLACRNADDKFTIVAFDLAREKFREVPPPSPTGGLKLQLPVLGFSCLAVLCGRLRAFNPDDTDVWVMEKYGARSLGLSSQSIPR
ncbi:hypothetical protein Cgig2_016257 [Carnegiea gigantea]|uniref:F-box associated beta-propeller type 1 domain-containing protein n=1 Tax=Carnegiea gigantea TaxID=171969 RepID=A0A9Q1KH78_9CARY|nr:hypothetical protein Cgig2_016257 [Carnegiea gigantea]